MDNVMIDELASGSHQLRVSLANNDHSPLNPPVEDSIVIDVKGPAFSAVATDLPY